MMRNQVQKVAKLLGISEKILLSVVPQKRSKSTSTWAKVSLGTTNTGAGGKSWEKLKLGFLGAPLNLGQVN
jgi:hypothetical protein